MSIGDEVADQIDAERPFCQCLRLSDEIAQDVGRNSNAFGSLASPAPSMYSWR